MKQKVTLQDKRFTIRAATPEDAAIVVSYMKKLGQFQQMADKITATPDRIEKLLASHQGEAIFGLYDDDVVGFAYFHEKSSAFTGRFGLYIDAFFLDDTERSKGLGKRMMRHLCKIAKDRECELLEWGCLDWNTAAIEFYQSLGAYRVDMMHIYRLTPEDLSANAELCY